MRNELIGRPLIDYNWREADSACSEYITGDREEIQGRRWVAVRLQWTEARRYGVVWDGMQGRLIGAAYIVQQPPEILLLRRNLSRIPLLPLSMETTDACVVSWTLGSVIAGDMLSPSIFMTCFTSRSLSRSTHKDPVESTRPTQYRPFLTFLTLDSSHAPGT